MDSSICLAESSWGCSASVKVYMLSKCFRFATDSSSFSQAETSFDTSYEALEADSFIVSPLPSSVNDLLKTNDPPIHAKFFETHLLEAEIVLSTLDQRLDKMKVQMAQFTARREEIVSVIQSYRDVLHPIRRTPPEVLLEIFSYCIDFIDVEHPSTCRHINSLDTKKGPWCLGQVCRYWRSVVLECPRLWSSLSIDVDKLLLRAGLRLSKIEAQRIDSDAILLLSHYLRRSKDCPLKIAIYCSRGMHPLLSEICAHSVRWAHIHLSLPADGFQILASVKGCLSKLKYVHLQSSTSSSDPVWDHLPPIDAFEYAPNMTSFRAHDIPNLASTVLVPWNQLTYCANGAPVTSVNVLREAGNRTNIDILTKANKLRIGVLVCGSLTPSVSIPSFRHEHLVFFTMELLRRSSPELITQLLDALTLPALRTLRLSVSSKQNPKPNVLPIIRLLQRSKCSLTKLRLKGFEMSVDDQGPYTKSPFKKLLETVNETLVSLCLDNFPTSVLSALTVAEGQAPLFPRLAELRMTSRCTPELDQMQVIGMMESRYKHSAFTTALLTTSVFPLTNEKAKKKMEELAKRGRRLEEMAKAPRLGTSVFPLTNEEAKEKMEELTKKMRREEETAKEV